MNNSPKNVNGGARTAAYRICAVASYDNISPKADHGDLFIRAVTGQMGALSRILLKIKSESDIHPSMVMHTWILCSPFNPHREHTHMEQWAVIYAAAPGEQLGVRCLA